MLDKPDGAETEWPVCLYVLEAKALLFLAASDGPCSSRGRFILGLEDMSG